MTTAARGVNATVLEKDIGTINGVIHVVDRILGVPYQTCGEMMAEDPSMRSGLHFNRGHYGTGLETMSATLVADK